MNLKVTKKNLENKILYWFNLIS